MKNLTIGTKTFYYINNNELIYKITKEFYFRNVILFNSVLAKTESDNKNPINVDVLKTKSVVVKNGDSAYYEWEELIKKLQQNYKTEEISDNDKISTSVKNEIDEKDLQEEIRLQYLKSLKSVDPTSAFGIILRYANVDDYGFSRKVEFSEFTPEDYKRAGPGNGNKGLRVTKGELIDMFTIKKFKGYRGLTVGYQFQGFNYKFEKYNRNIRADIKKVISELRCAHCNTHLNIEVDHKNGRYNDKMVLSTLTQNLSDFQPLCGKCNKMKRSSCIKCKANNIRFNATFLGYNVSAIEGDMKYDDALGCVGCYLYDCIAFKSQLTLNGN